MPGGIFRLHFIFSSPHVNVLWFTMRRMISVRSPRVSGRFPEITGRVSQSAGAKGILLVFFPGVRPGPGAACHGTGGCGFRGLLFRAICL